MKTFTPIAALILCWFIGIVVGKTGLWFPLGFVAMIAVALVQKHRNSSSG
jgi:hypothetical protein